MSPNTATLTQRAIARDVMAWCRAEDMRVTRQLLRRLATPVQPAETLVQLDLDDTAVLIYVDRIAVRMPHRTVAWAYALDDVPAAVAAITRVLETG